jgi:hypothetical protein
MVVSVCDDSERMMLRIVAVNLWNKILPEQNVTPRSGLQVNKTSTVNQEM